jgi:hypothetical protein
LRAARKHLAAHPLDAILFLSSLDSLAPRAKCSGEGVVRQGVGHPGAQARVDTLLRSLVFGMQKTCKRNAKVTKRQCPSTFNVLVHLICQLPVAVERTFENTRLRDSSLDKCLEKSVMQHRDDIFDSHALPVYAFIHKHTI